MFLVLTYDIGQAGTEIFRFADEHAFFERYLCHPVKEWFDAWNPEVLTNLSIREQEFYHCDAFAFPRGDNYYYFSGVCDEFLDAQEPNVIESVDEHTLYDDLSQLLTAIHYRTSRHYDNGTQRAIIRLFGQSRHKKRNFPRL